MTKGSILSFYRCPSDSERCRLWIAAIERKGWEPNNYSYVCSAHFVSGKKSNDHLSPDYIPSFFKHMSSPLKKKKKSDLEAFKRRKQTSRARLKNVLQQQARQEQERKERQQWKNQLGRKQLRKMQHCTATQMELSVMDIGYMEERSCEVRSVRESVLTREFLESSSSKVPDMIKFYTGLPSYPRLIAVFNYVSSSSVENSCSALPLFQQFLITLMKLRLNVSDQDIAYRFGITQSTVSKNFSKWINIMYIYLKPFIVWPGCEEVLKAIPEGFKREFKRCSYVYNLLF